MEFQSAGTRESDKTIVAWPGIRVPMCVCECARKRNAGVPAKLSKQRARGSPFGIDTMRARSPITHQHTAIYCHRLTLYHQHVFMFSDNSEMTNTMVDSWVCFEACFQYRSNNSYVILQRFLNHNESFNIILERQQEANDNKSLCKTMKELKKETKYCRSIFTSLSFWSANIVVFANVIYILPYLIVILIYSTVSGLRKRAYDSAVLCYNVSQVVLNSILIAVGWPLLCRVSLYFSVYTISCSALMFLDIFHLLALRHLHRHDPGHHQTPLDATIRSQTATSSRKTKVPDILCLGLGISFVPTAIACIVELSPLVPKSQPIKPNFKNFSNGPNIAVIVYVATIPMLICLMNSILFIYRTYKIIIIKKSAVIARKTTIKANESYFMFLKLYFLMDSPWITSALGAIYTELWVFKFFRMIQPILMLIVIFPKDSFRNTFRKCPFFKCKSITHNKENVEIQQYRFSSTVRDNLEHVSRSFIY